MLVTEYEALISTLSSYGLRVFANVNELRPPGVLIDPPTFRSISPQIVEVDYPIHLVAAPPGDWRALKATLDAVDTVLENLTPASQIIATPGVYSVGNQDLPSYQITATITYRRD